MKQISNITANNNEVLRVDRNVNHILVRFRAIWGPSFSNRFEIFDRSLAEEDKKRMRQERIDEFKREWARELYSFTRDEINRGIENAIKQRLKIAPNLLTFVELCTITNSDIKELSCEEAYIEACNYGTLITETIDIEVGITKEKRKKQIAVKKIWRSTAGYHTFRDISGFIKMENDENSRKKQFNVIFNGYIERIKKGETLTPPPEMLLVEKQPKKTNKAKKSEAQKNFWKNQTLFSRADIETRNKGK